MRPIDPKIKVPVGWKQVTFAKDQKEYLPLPAILEDADSGQVITCWRLTWKERLQAIFSGKLWLSMMTFHHPLQPILLSVEQPQFVVPEEK